MAASTTFALSRPVARGSFIGSGGACKRSDPARLNLAPAPRAMRPRRTPSARAPVRASAGSSDPGPSSADARAARVEALSPDQDLGGISSGKTSGSFLQSMWAAGIPVPGFSPTLYISVIIPPLVGLGCAYLSANPEIAEANGIEAAATAMTIKYGMGATALLVLLANSAGYMTSDEKMRKGIEGYVSSKKETSAAKAEAASQSVGSEVQAIKEVEAAEAREVEEFEKAWGRASAKRVESIKTKN